MVNKINCFLCVCFQFLALCQPLMSKSDRDLILRRVDSLVQQTNLHYLASEQFHDLVQDLTQRVGADRDNVYVHLKTLTDELRAYREKRPKPKTQSAVPASVSDGGGTVATADGSEDAETAAAQSAAGDEETASDSGGATSSANVEEEAAEGSGSGASSGKQNSHLGSPLLRVVKYRKGTHPKFCENRVNIHMDSCPDPAAKSKVAAETFSMCFFTAYLEITDVKNKQKEVLLQSKQNLKLKGEPVKDINRKAPQNAQTNSAPGHAQKLHKAIAKLRRKEVDWDSEDDGNSAYLMEDRYQRKSMKVWRKICELQGRRPLTGRVDDKRFRYSGSRYPEINEAVSKMVNKKKIFPDFTDILGLVKSHNELSGLGLGSSQVEQIARDVFMDVGQALQARRKREEHQLALLHLEVEGEGGEGVAVDPAETDEGLRARLEDNARLFHSKMDQVLQTFVDKQHELKLEPRDVEEEDCDRSPPPSPKTDGGEEEDEEEEEEEEEEEDLFCMCAVEDSPGEDEEKTGEEEAENDAEDASGVTGAAGGDEVASLGTQPCAATAARCPKDTKSPVEAEVITIPSDDEGSPPAKKAKT
ncbi:unnamed protein product [Ixodes hexagonus]